MSMEETDDAVRKLRKRRLQGRNPVVDLGTQQPVSVAVPVRAAKTWKEDKPFITWLVKQAYARYDTPAKLVHSFSGDGIVMYMWEAYCAGKDEL